MNPSPSNAKGRYQQLAVYRQPFLDRARDCAKLTIPSLLPPSGSNGTLKLPETYQDLGARCVVALASRLMVAFYPPGQSSFRLNVPAHVLIKSGRMELPTDLDRSLSLAERIVNSEIERRGWRHPTYTALLYLIVSGNVLEHIMDDNRIRVFRLDQYVVVRDPTGNMTELIIEEFLSPPNLPPNIRELVNASDLASSKIPIYTWCKLDKKGKWTVHQEVSDKIVPGSKGTYDKLPFHALRWSAVIGEDYGRGKCEEHIGNLRSVEGLSKALLDGAALASRHVTVVRPNAAGGLNLRRRLAEANNGEIIVGNIEDINTLQYENINGIQVAQAEIARISQDLSAAFLLNSAARREAERVTAYELRMMVEEIESTLGGVYSMLAFDMQQARLERLIYQMQKSNELPEWPEDSVDVVIITGLEALGREQDVTKVSTALQFIAQMPEMGQQYVKFPAMLSKAFVGLGLPDCVYSEEEAQKRMKDMMAQNIAGSVAEAGGVQAAQNAANAATAPAPQ